MDGDHDMMTVIDEVFGALRKAEAKHPGWPMDPIHAAAIVGEEAGELTRAALQYHYEGVDSDPMLQEAAETAAMAIRFLINARLHGYDTVESARENYR